ncbi:hypothetical protein ACIP5Y_25360 [Nocardia sp. NPDC088792]|uniref:hypothetical protein n=1 Tax=Nocardia sp. NPDC088792 TaxID=3364332 RepID=UPI0037FA421D
MKSILRQQLPATLAASLILGALVTGTAQAAPNNPAPTASTPITAGDNSGSSASGSANSPELSNLWSLVLCALQPKLTQGCTML